MYIRTFHLKRAGTLVQAFAGDTSLVVVYGEGGGCTLDATGGAAAACIPLRGSLQVHANGLVWSVHAGELLFTDHDERTVMLGHADACWLAMLGDKHAWTGVLPSVPASGSQLLPNLHDADHEVRLLAIALARSVLSTDIEGAVNALADKFVAMQAPLHEAIARCPGRTWINKRQVFLRLQRVRNYIVVCCDQELDIDVLAKMANYSPCHFLRTFHLAFQMTPHAYLIEQRLQRARRLLRSSNLAVTEVAAASGFENRSAFSRLFHKRFGATAQETKHRCSVAAVDANRSAS